MMSLHISTPRASLGLYHLVPRPPTFHPILFPRSLIFFLSFHQPKATNSQPNMCFITDVFFVFCAHWGVPQVETSCAAGALSKQKSGCWNNTVVGTKRTDELCPACRYRKSVITAQGQYLPQTQTPQSFEQIMQEQATQKQKQAGEEAEKKSVIVHLSVG